MQQGLGPLSLRDVPDAAQQLVQLRDELAARWLGATLAQRDEIAAGLRALADALAASRATAVQLRAAWDLALAGVIGVPMSRQVLAGAGLTGGGSLSGDVSIGMADSGATAGSYTLASVTVDRYGRVTAAASGSGGSTTDVVLQEIWLGDIGGTWWFRQCSGSQGSAYSASVLYQHPGTSSATYEFEISARTILPVGQTWRADVYARTTSSWTQRGSVAVAEGARANSVQLTIQAGEQLAVATISSGDMQDAQLLIKKVS